MTTITIQTQFTDVTEYVDINGAWLAVDRLNVRSPSNRDSWYDADHARVMNALAMFEDALDILIDNERARSTGDNSISSTHTTQCEAYWERGLECRCIPEGVKQDIRNGANPEDVM